MIVDTRALQENKTIDTDVCIIGAGTAGLTVAREFIGQNFQVCLIESGGLKPDQETQALARGENIGHPYYSLDTARIRCIGGSSNRWDIAIGNNNFGARMRPLDSIDFEERDWVPYSGWPFPKSHLDPFYQRAQKICKIEPTSFSVADWEETPHSLRLPLSNGRVETVIFKFGSRNPFIEDYVQEVTRAANIDTYLYANVINIETNEAARTLKSLQVACLSGSKFRVSAKIIILATGAIEIPRLLLLSNQNQTTGLGNQNDLVGRFFMEHPHYSLGLWVPSDENIFQTTGLYNNIHPVNGVPIRGKLSLSETVLRREKLLNYVTQINPMVMLYSSLVDEFIPKIRSDSVKSFIAIYKAIFRGDNPDGIGSHLKNISSGMDDVISTIYRTLKKRVIRNFSKKKIKLYEFENMSEQVPNPDSRVTLSSDKDRLGLNRVRLDWRLSPIDMDCAIRSQDILDQEFQREGLGRLYNKYNNETPSKRIIGGWHHMGTTRMHIDPKKGVVDQNSRVHNCSNLYVAGPSVFPTGGYANPSLTIVALSVRLADHIKMIMKR